MDINTKKSFMNNIVIKTLFKNDIEKTEKIYLKMLSEIEKNDEIKIIKN